MKTKYNSLLYLLLAFLYLIPILFTNQTHLNLAVAALALCNALLWAKINVKYLLFFLALLILPLVSVFVTTLIYIKPSLPSEVLLEIGSVEITRFAWQNAIYLASRSFSLSFVSFLFILCISPVELVFSLMQNWKLSVNIGYPIMATLFAFEKLKDEFLRIQTANAMRFGKKIPLFRMLIPLLVSASRHAYQVGLSLESRGLQKNKTFIDYFFWEKRDTFVFALNGVQLLLILLLF